VEVLLGLVKSLRRIVGISDRRSKKPMKLPVQVVDDKGRYRVIAGSSALVEEAPALGTLIVFTCEMEDAHVKGLAGNRQRKRLRSQHR
jgi:hypothetical protein